MSPQTPEERYPTAASKLAVIDEYKAEVRYLLGLGFTHAECSEMAAEEFGLTYAILSSWRMSEDVSVLLAARATNNARMETINRFIVRLAEAKAALDKAHGRIAFEVARLDRLDKELCDTYRKLDAEQASLRQAEVELDRLVGVNCDLRAELGEAKMDHARAEEELAASGRAVAALRKVEDELDARLVLARNALTIHGIPLVLAGRCLSLHERIAMLAGRDTSGRVG